MVGVITGWDVLAHPIVTIECFGWQVFFRAIAPWQHQTFLSLLPTPAMPKPAVAEQPTDDMHAILQRCIDLELRAKRLYLVLAEALDDRGLVGVFFTGLAEQEQYHADLLELCRKASERRGWRAGTFNPWKEYLPRLEQEMTQAEASIHEINSVDDALRLVIEVESSEINKVFDAAMAATDARFVKKLRPFQIVMEAHMTYIIERVSELSPRLMVECRELRAKFSKAKALDEDVV